MERIKKTKSPKRRLIDSPINQNNIAQKVAIKDNRPDSEKLVNNVNQASNRINITQRQPDPIEEAVLDKDKEKVKKDFDAAMQKIKDKIIAKANDSAKMNNILKKSGRDWMVYAPWSSWLYGMLDLLKQWNNKWTIEDSAGLLLDIGGSIKGITSQMSEGTDIMNKEMSETRTNQKTINNDSQWAKDLPEGTQTQAGVSATTGNLLLMLRYLDVNTALEIEAIINGVILYWKNSSLKQALKQFHTASEVWSAYTYHVENYVNKKKKDEE